MANHSKVFIYIILLQTAFSHFLRAKMKDRITTDRKLVSILLFKFTALYVIVQIICNH